MSKLRVEGFSSLVRDTDSNAIVNVNKSEYQLYMSRYTAREKQSDVSGTVITTGDTGTITGTMIAADTIAEANMADDAIGQDQLKSVVELRILDSNGTVVKTMFAAGA